MEILTMGNSGESVYNLSFQSPSLYAILAKARSWQVEKMLMLKSIKMMQVFK